MTIAARHLIRPKFRMLPVITYIEMIFVIPIFAIILILYPKILNYLQGFILLSVNPELLTEETTTTEYD